MKFGYYYFFGQIFKEVLDIYEDKIIVKKKRKYSWNDIAFVLKEDNILSYLLGPPGFSIFFKDGKVLRITNTIQKKFNKEPFYFFNTKAFDEIREIIYTRVKNTINLKPKQFSLLLLLSIIFMFPALIIMYILKVDIFSMYYNIVLLSSAIITGTMYILITRKKTKMLIQKHIQS